AELPQGLWVRPRL
nr:RecName: Full=Pyrokinin-4; Short=PK-4 [Praedatophasma maraisi]B3A0I9.1 RecName: Full=Pyrokinin-4; Short=PK-4 [Tyrannophasma gladiator]